MNNDDDLYSNKRLYNLYIIFNFFSLQYFVNKEYNKEALAKYKKNFNLIKDSLDIILLKLIKNVQIIPYSIRCICKIIFLLIDHKVKYK
jgi:hypothetical protein